MTYNSSMYKKLERVIVKHPEDAFISQEHLSNQWKTFNYLQEPNFEEAVREYKGFIEILEKYVQQIDYLPKAETGNWIGFHLRT